MRLPPAGGEPLGVLDVIHSSFVNLSSQEAQGLDISAHYGLELDSYGDLKFGLEWSYLDKFEKDGLDYTGEYEYPQYRWLASTNWTMGDFAANLNVSYIGEFEDTPDINFDGALDFTENKSRMVDAQFLVDLQAPTVSTKCSSGRSGSTTCWMRSRRLP